MIEIKDRDFCIEISSSDTHEIEEAKAVLKSLQVTQKIRNQLNEQGYALIEPAFCQIGYGYQMPTFENFYCSNCNTTNFFDTPLPGFYRMHCKSCGMELNYAKEY